MDLTIFGANERVNVFDVSGGGLCFTRRISNKFRNIEVGDMIRLSINLSEHERLWLDCKVIRKSYKGHIEYIGVRFSNMPMKDKQILLGALNRIQRITLRKRSGLHYT
jgi:c-di-GMP-binding flagellar brake protein YcgR